MTIQPSPPELQDSDAPLSHPQPLAAPPSLGGLLFQGPPIIAHGAATSAPPAGEYGTPPPTTGYGTPPPLLPSAPTADNSNAPRTGYSAYPEHLRNTPPPQGHYQAGVSGLNGWNDLPTHMVTGIAVRKKGQSGSGTTSGTASPAPLASLDDPSSVLNDVVNSKGLIVGAFTTAMDRVKSGAAEASQRRMIEDTDKRLENLYERLSADQVPNHVLASAVQLATALNNKDYTTCHSIVMALMTTSFDQEGKWVLGAKRLVELCQRVG
ncbi:hypothetical protein SpCBS45565_g04772 [Spizellomyces sp. 'palustris']|nr:hypothetical protein SpCBS45565_g04772 [Spizellomyces sp. 'palustris']